ALAAGGAQAWHPHDRRVTSATGIVTSRGSGSESRIASTRSDAARLPTTDGSYATAVSGGAGAGAEDAAVGGPRRARPGRRKRELAGNADAELTAGEERAERQLHARRDDRRGWRIGGEDP